ncbi:ABC transporter ATP-binding protein [Planobispora rosea]|uniref:ABC transporter ATP-binding protein n=1 Tax=Planobispora rosea TaxID=35762 RepID=A0A8J3S376_PLARO|nr:ABC transporter ATP-binding protein [Planobispora rosea]GGS80780.1 ABC transporter ATP-binding protein [Planobispora rosea]GIH85964.1 ABC transporter ATP-binding protein [Planobispora rosea]
MLEARALRKAFGRTTALDGVSAEIGEGEIIAITGPSGSGKSTLLHCLAGIIRPEAGEVRLDGRRVDTLDEDDRTRLRRENFGIVFQFGQLVPELSAVENVALPLLFNRHGRRESLRTARSWLERLDTADCADHLPGELSGGQLQRVAVARALAVGPRVVFADEPTGALDSLAGEQVMDTLVGTARESRTTLVIVTHDNRVAAYADREIVLRDGTVAGASTVGTSTAGAPAAGAPAAGGEATT